MYDIDLPLEVATVVKINLSPSTEPFYNDDYLQLSYHNADLATKQLGVVVLGLSSDAKVLRGYYTGFSPTRDTIVAGNIELHKSA